ncbi:amino acid permease/ SLC12A domain-containing protein [Aspergillus caelatus]|uniref:Amino acid permease/ SLC12A domain-containing protein n=1 Tax=Aspergillus caelatus TaxID=61420 RepID=A0A5N6ZMW5_9EURO|nr:amino acid permease/ SLC12A domain-containing protein [Aspergillus caelatus]KAE8358326.1 amino acid permease/ SLC12A domain-containing protein [Aspergillus caelatus]
MDKKSVIDDHQVSKEDAGNGIVTQYRETQRGLSSRQVQLMAIGGSIGTGLFVGIGSYLRDTGPLSVFLGYMFYGILFVWPVNLCVGEMCAYLPIRGSIFELAARYVDPAFGFAMGWVYFYGGLMLVCTEYSAVATVMQYWTTSVNPAAWVAMALVVCFLLNIVAVKWYGESEFIMASTKILLLIGLVMLTFITMVGGNPKHDVYGFRNWTHGVMYEYYTDGATGRFLGFFSVMVYAAFSVAGPDLPALAAGEIQNPRWTIPRVVKMTFYRIVGFYVVGVLAVGIICSPQDPRLLSAIDSDAAGANASPWVIGIQNLDIHGLPDLINVLILFSGWSCGNAYLYSSSRTLYSLARDGQAPRFLLKCNSAGVPIYCVITVSLLSCISFLVADTSAVTVLYWFIDLTTCALIITYTSMVCVFLGWYRALKAQGVDRKTALPWVAPFQPYFAIGAVTIGSLITLFNGFNVFSPFSVQGFITSYFGLAFFVVMFLFWKLYHKTEFVDPATADIYSGKAEIDAECRIWEDGGFKERRKAELAQMHWARRMWEKMW